MRSAPSRFAHDGTTQNYVELEGGGKAAFARLLSGEVYSPYRWEVRLFKPREIAEARVRFRPDGTAYGFSRYVPEIGTRAARSMTRPRAPSPRRTRACRLGRRLRPLQAARAVAGQRPNGRVDHTFVYERDDVMLGDAHIRLQLTVSGDALTEVTHFVHVPEAFGRRFDELRSANDTIARVASLTAGVLYGLGGCILGVVWLMRRHWLLWRPALVAGAIVAGLDALAMLANAPQAWFGYDTAQSTAVFWGQQVGVAVPGVRRRRARACARVHGGGEPVAQGLCRSSAAVAPLVARCRADAADPRAHARRLSFRSASSSRSSPPSITSPTAISDGGSPPNR